MAKEMDPNNVEFLKPLEEMEYIPSVQDVNTNLEKYKMETFSFSDLSALGTAFIPVLSSIQSFMLKEGTSGFYYVNTLGKTMFTKNGENAFIGSLRGAGGGIGGGQARIMPIPLDPVAFVSICMAAALANIEHKINVIEKSQKEMMEFLELKEEAKLKGNLNALGDVLNNYKYNWNNDAYKATKRVLVQDIKKDSEERQRFLRTVYRN